MSKKGDEIPFHWAENDPPSPEELRRKGPWYKRLEPLVQHQGKWGVFKFASRSRSNSAATAIKKRYLYIPREDYDWEVRAIGCDLYVRFKGSYLSEAERKKIAQWREKKKHKETRYRGNRRNGETQ